MMLSDNGMREQLGLRNDEKEDLILYKLSTAVALIQQSRFHSLQGRSGV
jgi:hypothetical protein